MKNTVRAVVFSGGGAKGGYQIGAWKALREMDFHPDIVTGTSVGALNGALMALDKFDEALEIWENMGMSRVFSQFVERTDEDNPSLEHFIPKIAKEALFEGGADFTPLQELVKGMMDEDALRKSPIRFGLVTTKLPAVEAVELFIEDIPIGQAADYVLASAACFPFMKSYKIGDHTFVDGGYSDNMPIQMALDAGANDIVVLNISNLTQQNLSENDAVFHYIHNKRPFNNGQKGSMLYFEKNFSRQNIEQGYLDTLKNFGMLDGDYYCFFKNEKYKNKEQEKLCMNKFDSVFSNFPQNNKNERNGRQSVLNYLNRIEDNPFTYNSNYLYCAESAAEIFEINPRKIYSCASLENEIFECVYNGLLEEREEDLMYISKALDKGMSIEFLTKKLTGWNKKLLTLYGMQLLLNEKLNVQQKNRLWKIADLAPDVFCASIFCWSIIIKKDS